jgi:hypothetical protein
MTFATARGLNSDQGDVLAARLSPELCETLGRPPPGGAPSMTGKRAPKATRHWPLPDGPRVHQWVLVDCRPFGVRPRRLIEEKAARH